MIIIPSGAGLSSRKDADDQSEDDIHICGVCKEQFTDIFLFMRHKSENNCHPKHVKKLTPVSVPSSSGASNSSVVLSSVPGSGIRSETKYTRVSLVNTEAFTIRKEEVLKDVATTTCEEPEQPVSPADPPHLLLADLASQRLGLLNQDLTSVDRPTDTEINLEDDWDSSWSAAKVLGTFSVSNSLRRLQNQSLLTLKENGSVEGIAHEEDSMQEKPVCQVIEQESIEPCTERSVLTITSEKQVHHEIHVDDCQVAERFIGPHGGFLDVEDVEVATLLANHLTNEPTLHIYPHTSESFLSYNNLQNQLVIQDSSDTLTFESNAEREEVLEQNCKGQNCAKSCNDDGSGIPLKESQQNGITRHARKQKVHLCDHDGCDFRGVSVRDLERHVRKHTGERPFKCQECDKAFTRRDKLAAHLRCHSGLEKMFQCSICEFASKERTGLVIHMRRHTDERPYKCQICEYKARTKSHLNVHLRKHTGDHPYKCKKCNRAFTTGSDLTRHSRIHTGEKPFACPHCTYRAALKTSLRTHIQQNHLPGISLVCPKCNDQCKSQKDLRAHARTHKDDPKKCSKCDFIGSNNTALKNHLRVHTREKVKTSPLLNGKRGGPRGFQKKRSPLKRQRKVIETEEASMEVHNCAYCNASFWRGDALEEHIGQHEPVRGLAAPAPQDPVLADSADSRDSADSDSVDATCGLAGLAALASEQQPTFLYRYISGAHGDGSNSSDSNNDDLRNAEILASLNQSSGTLPLPQYVAIQTEQGGLHGGLVDSLNCIQYVLPSPLGALDDNDNATSLLC